MCYSFSAIRYILSMHSVTPVQLGVDRRAVSNRIIARAKGNILAPAISQELQRGLHLRGPHRLTWLGLIVALGLYLAGSVVCWVQHRHQPFVELGHFAACIAIAFALCVVTW